jgi:hypothetical protein
MVVANDQREQALSLPTRDSGPASALPGPLDRESSAWLARLGAGGREREQALAELHALLLGAARFALSRQSKAELLAALKAGAGWTCTPSSSSSSAAASRDFAVRILAPLHDGETGASQRRRR